MAHTEGPWKVDVPYPNEVYIVGNNGRTVAFVVHNDDERKEQMDDARLIASAPDLLAEVTTLRAQRDKLAAALRELTDYTVGLYASGGETLQPVIKARAALARLEAT